MLFDRKFERAMQWVRERRGDSPKALEDESLGSKLEKGDTLALILSALLVILPAVLLLLGVAVLAGYLIVVR